MGEHDSHDELADDLLERGQGLDTAMMKTLGDDAEVAPPEEPHWSHTLLCTTASVPGRHIAKTMGVVTGRVVIGQGVWRKASLGSSGKRNRSVEDDLHKIEQECLKEIKKSAHHKGANAVVGFSLHFGETSGEANLFFANATGTAVRVE